MQDIQITIEQEHTIEPKTEITIFPKAQNNNSSFAETICRNREIFMGKYEIDIIKRYIDYILQQTLEVEINPQERQETTGWCINIEAETRRARYHPLTKQERYLLNQNNAGQNVLHLAINTFKHYSNRLQILYVLVECLKGYLSYEAWYYMCFLQVNNTQKTLDVFEKNPNPKQVSIDGKDYKLYSQTITLAGNQDVKQQSTNRGQTVIQNLYYLRSPMIIGAYDGEHQRYNIKQPCIECFNTYQDWGVTKNVMNDKAYQNVTEEQKNKESIVLRKIHIAQYILKKYCSNKFGEKYLYRITIWSDSPQTFFDLKLRESEEVKFHFVGKYEHLNKFLGRILGKVFYECKVFNRYATNYAFDKYHNLQKFIDKAVDRIVPKKDEALEESSIDVVLEELANVKIIQDGSIKITQVSPKREGTINKFNLENISEIFDQHCGQMLHPENVRDFNKIINIPKFLTWLVSPETKLTLAQMSEILLLDGVVFALRLWMQEVVDTTYWRVVVSEQFRYNEHLNTIELNVFGFLVYIGVPLVLLKKVLSTNESTGDGFGMMLCSTSFSHHFDLINQQRWKLYQNAQSSPSIAYAMLLTEKRNLEVDKLNAEFLAYFVNPEEQNEFNAQLINTQNTIEQMMVKRYFENTLKCSKELANHSAHYRDPIPQEMIKQAKECCLEYIESYNADSKSIIRATMPKESFLKKAMEIEYKLELAKENIKPEADRKMYQDVCFKITYEVR